MLPDAIMITRRRIALLFALLVAAPASLPGQDQPKKGKIDDVERSADSARRRGSDDHVESEGGFFGFHAAGVLFFGVAPRDTGQGYLKYPYAPGTGETFVRRRVTEGRRFGTVSASYFGDDQSTLRAGFYSVEWAGGFLNREIEFSSYAEPMGDHTDRLQMFRLTFAGVPPLGDLGYVKLGVGFQLVTVGGDAATGPEFEAGVQLFPLRPFGLSATARVAPLTWAGGPEFGVGFADLVGRGSVFVGPVELMAGYRWTRIGVGAPFRGPTLGVRVWF